MKTSTPPAYTRDLRQRGAVAIMFGLSIFVLFGFMALAIDLGRTYVVRTELQNAADAAALAGAKQLNQTKAGVDSAVSHAIAMAAQNNFKFSTPVTITIANLSVGSCPDDSCMVSASSVTTNAQAAGKTFLKVDIPSGALTTFFAVVPTTAAGTGTASTSTYGRAVAGYFVVPITPIGVCAIDLKKGGRLTHPGPPALPDELTEFGYRRGVAYDLMNLGKIGPNSTPFLLNPVDVYPGPPCNNNNSNATFARDFVCTGTSAVIVTVPTNAFGSTGFSWGPVRDALNSRFEPDACAPQDTNRREYTVPLIAQAADPRNWTQPGANTLPSQQSISIGSNNLPVPSPTAAQYGTLWSYSRAVQAVGVSPNATAGTPFTLADWPSLYAGSTADTTTPTGYPLSPSIPPFPTGTLAAPYNTQSGSPYFRAPSSPPGLRDRRVLNLAIVNCPLASGNNCSSTIPIVGIGKFFMQRKAVNPKSIHAEFDGLIDPIPPHEIRLYR